MKSVTSVFLIVTMLSLAVAVSAPASTLAPQGTTITVTSSADSGPGTLRQALLDAQNGDTITFDPTTFPPSAPVTISPTSALPRILQGNLTLDASNAGVILDGSNVPGDWVACLDIDSAGNTVQGFQVSNYSGPGIAVAGTYNLVGGDRGAGAGPFGQGNLTIHNDVGIGMWGSGASFNTVRGNLIGSDAAGVDDLGNRVGVEISEGANGNVIGPDNVIAYSGETGVSLRYPESLHNTITQNSIHDNDGMGIRLSDGANTELAVPAILGFDLPAGTVTGTTCANCTVEIFSDSGDEGAIYEGRTTADGSGTFTFDKGTSFVGPHLTATATDASGNTSEFSVPAAEPETIVVTSSADSGPGTLRQALLDALGGDTIIFDSDIFPPSAPVTISLTSALPQVNQSNLTIDGSNAGVVLDGSSIPTGTWALGLEIHSNGNTVLGLQIVDFPGPGIGLYSSSQNNTIGGDRGVGTAPLGQGNLISRNRSVGIHLGDSSFNTIRGNYIGTDPSGTEAWGNRYNGVFIYGGSHNQIIDNLISDNGEGVGLEGSKSSNNIISGNYIGTDASKENPLSNHGCGISIRQGAGYNMVGPDNVIAYNGLCGVEVFDPDTLGNTITQNSIHDNYEYGICAYWGVEFVAPIIFDFDLPAGSAAGITCANCTVEIFSDSDDEGARFEGQTTADGTGIFTFNKGAPFIGPHLTATATDVDGNTSVFSLPTSGTAGSAMLQHGNGSPATRFQTRQSRDLLDNRIGAHSVGHWSPAHWDYLLYSYGLKRSRVFFNNQEPPVQWDLPEFEIRPEWDAMVTRLADNGFVMKYYLTFWDKATYPGGEGIPCPRFKTEGEIVNYLEYVRFIVRHFKDRIQYYEMWNEPDVEYVPGVPDFCTKHIEVDDYINLVKRTVPVIREEYPEAKIAVGAISLLRAQPAQDYLFALLESDIMPLVDVVSWHPLYSESPEYEATQGYYYAYPSLVQEIKDVASAHGFDGEFQVDELTWQTTGTGSPDVPWEYSPTVAAKYTSRAIVMHLGMDIATTINKGLGDGLRALCTVMAGALPADLPVQIQTTVTNTVSYTFSSPYGDHLVALWTNGIATEYDPGITATVTLPGFVDHTVTLPGFVDHRVTGVDVLHGFEQPVIASEEDGSLVIRDLLVKDYPIILRLSSTKYIFLPIVLKGYPH